MVLPTPRKLGARRTGTLPPVAGGLGINNDASGLEAETVQDAIDELANLADWFADVPLGTYVQTFATADRTHAARTSAAVATTAATQTTPYGFATQAQADAIVTAINALRADLADTAALVNAVVDDLQAAGIFA